MLNVLIHELAHMAMCRILHRKILSFRAGSGPSLMVGTARIGLIPIGGGVTFCTVDLRRSEKLAIFFSGPVASWALLIIHSCWAYPGHAVVEVHAAAMLALSLLGGEKSDLYQALH